MNLCHGDMSYIFIIFKSEFFLYVYNSVLCTIEYQYLVDNFL